MGFMITLYINNLFPIPNLAASVVLSNTCVFFLFLFTLSFSCIRRFYVSLLSRYISRYFTTFDFGIFYLLFSKILLKYSLFSNIFFLKYSHMSYPGVSGNIVDALIAFSWIAKIAEV